jgi:cobalt-zinc-cadmium efflux system membrane fusion protein
MNLHKAIWFTYCIFAISACGNKPESQKETTTVKETETHHEASNVVSLSNQQMDGARIVIGAVEMKNLTTAIKVNGTLVVPNQNKALITSLAGGVLRSLKIQPGEYVHKGQLIGTICNAQISGIQQQLISITAQLKYAEQEEKRLSELVAGNAAPLKSLQRVESELNGLKAQRNALKEQLSALGLSASAEICTSVPITAPIGGTISEISAQIGSNITANEPIAQITNNSELHLDLFVYEKDLSYVEPGQKIHFTLTNAPGKEYDAEIYSIGTAFVNESKAVPVHCRVINKKTGLIEGMNVTARISLGQKVYTVVPDEAIVNHAGNDYIFVLKGESNQQTSNETSFERLPVVRGVSDIGYTEIQPVVPLPEGTKIAVKGSFFLIAKMTNVEEEHEH